MEKNGEGDTECVQRKIVFNMFFEAYYKITFCVCDSMC